MISHDLVRSLFLAGDFGWHNHGKQNDSKMFVSLFFWDSHEPFGVSDSSCEKVRGSWNGRCQASGGKGGGCIGRISEYRENEN